jgi:hypothetical protein
MGAHSRLAASAREIIDAVIQLASRYTELHRAMRQFITLFKDRGIDTAADVEIMGFVGRMVVALQNCVYEIVDTSQSPQAFFGHLRRMFHSAAVYLDLSPPVREYFDELKNSGESEFIALLGQQKKALGASPKWKIYEDLSYEVQAALDSIDALRRLEKALEGKYIDFRVNPILDAMNYIFDRETQSLYKLHAPSSRVQGSEDRIAFTFAKLDLEGRKSYRLVLMGEDGAVFTEDIAVEIHINAATGYRKEPKRATYKIRDHEQRNFEFDFESDVPSITDLQVTLDSYHPIKIALLFIRQLFYAPKVSEPVKPLQRESNPREEGLRRDRFAEERAWNRPDTADAPPRARDREPVRESNNGPSRPEQPSRRLSADEVPPRRSADPPPSPPRHESPGRDWRDRDNNVPPRDRPDKTQRLERPWPGPDDPPNPPKRRRLG